MTIGSAASLAGTLPRAPLSPVHCFRQRRRPAARPYPVGAGVPPLRLPRAGLADDPPRGRVLVVEDDALVALDLQCLLREAGYRVVGPAATIEEAERLIARGSIDGAVLDVQVQGLVPVAFADSLADRGIPFIWLTDAPCDRLPEAHADVASVAKSCAAAQFIDALERAMSRGADHQGKQSWYPVPPPQPVWPRVFPQL
jgi:CheY-like chemotaxis protein